MNKVFSANPTDEDWSGPDARKGFLVFTFSARTLILALTLIFPLLEEPFPGRKRTS